MIANSMNRISIMSEYMKLFHEDIDFKNRYILGSVMPQFLWEPLPHILRTWLRTYVITASLYFTTGFIWSFYVYYLKPKIYNSSQEKHIPKLKMVVSSIKASMKAMPWYALLPTLADSMIERGWTKCYPTLGEVRWHSYIMYVITYLVFLEFMSYWLHRGMHEIKPLYNHLHYIHHIYNNKDSISPFTAFALHPMEGWIMLLPHVLVLFIIPTHFTTYHAIMFLSGMWTFNIHDCLDVKSWPLMGSSLHTVHHVLQRRNYGFCTIFLDIVFDTFRDTTTA